MAHENQSLLGVGELQGLQSFGTITAIAGAAQSAIGAFFAAESQRYQLKSQALELELRQSLANLNARAAEREAQSLLEAGQDEKARATLRFGQAKGASRARSAAAGVQAGVGSAAEVDVSIEAAKEIDSLTIERNALRAANSARMRAVNFQNQALLTGVSARNVRGAIGSINPVLASATSLLGGAGQVTASLLRQSRFNRLLDASRRRQEDL